MLRNVLSQASILIFAAVLIAGASAHAWNRANAAGAVYVAAAAPVGPSLIDAAPGQVDAQVRALAGLPAHSGQPAAQWPCSGAEISAYAAQRLPEAHENARSVVYFFGGFDFIYPDLFAPNANNVVIVSSEAVGRVPAVGRFPVSTVNYQFHNLNGCQVETYGVTSLMRGNQNGLGTVTLVAIAIASRGYRVDAVESVSLQPSGEIVGGGRGVPGARIAYTKPNGEQANAYYFGATVSDGSLRSSGFEALLSQGFDLAFYKATMFVPEHMRGLNRLVLNNVKYVIQNDDGIPYNEFDASWDVRLFGTYAAPSKIFAGQTHGSQSDLYREYASSICASHEPDRDLAVNAMSRAWGRPLCANAGTPRATWGGLIQSFRYGYTGSLTNVSGVPQAYFSNIIYGVRR